MVSSAVILLTHSEGIWYLLSSANAFIISPILPLTLLLTGLLYNLRLHNVNCITTIEELACRAKCQEQISTDLIHLTEDRSYIYNNNNNNNSVALVLERTIPTERPPLVGEVSANFCG
jgi:hypothetical protein